MRQYRQIHVWISESDYLLLREQSVEAKDSVSSILRRMIKAERDRQREEQAADRPAAVDGNAGALQ